MAFEIEVSPAAWRDLKALSSEVRARMKIAIDDLAAHPRPPGVKKLRGEDRTYRIRVGDYRVVYEIHDKVLIVLVVRVRHRREAYR